jgi:hypothetical protein
MADAELVANGWVPADPETRRPVGLFGGRLPDAMDELMSRLLQKGASRGDRPDWKPAGAHGLGEDPADVRSDLRCLQRLGIGACAQRDLDHRAQVPGAR